MGGFLLSISFRPDIKNTYEWQSPCLSERVQPGNPLSSITIPSGTLHAAGQTTQERGGNEHTIHCSSSHPLNPLPGRGRLAAVSCNKWLMLLSDSPFPSVLHVWLSSRGSSRLSGSAAKCSPLSEGPLAVPEGRHPSSRTQQALGTTMLRKTRQ